MNMSTESTDHESAMKDPAVTPAPASGTGPRAVFDPSASRQPLGLNHGPSATGTRLDACASRDMPAFIGYLPYGFPDHDTSIAALETLVRSGTDIVEIGLPYSDPVMDGPVIQSASQIALAAGERMEGVFDAVSAVARAGGIPLVMSYWNLIFHYGVERFAARFADAGGAGLITPDLIPDEAGEWIESSQRHGLDRIFLVSPDSTDERLRVVARAGRGFVYAASRMGVTGERSTLSTTPQELVRRAKAAGAEHVCVGIGVSTPEQARQVGAYADGVIVGSALVHTLLDGRGAALSDRDRALHDLRLTATALARAAHEARRES